MNKLLQKEEYEKSLNLTLELLREGNSMPEIAYKRKLAFSTIEKHLARLIEDKKINVDELLDKDKIELIKKASDNNLSLGEIKSILPHDISYAEIRYVLASLGRIKSRKPPIQLAINTYLGNYCYRKCFNHQDIILECEAKFNSLAKSMKNIPITFKEFNEMVKSDQIKICKLPFDKRKMYVSWKRFEYYKWNRKDYWDIKDEDTKFKR